MNVQQNYFHGRRNKVEEMLASKQKYLMNLKSLVIREQSRVIRERNGYNKLAIQLLWQDHCNKENRRLLVSNLHPKMTVKHLREVFGPFGICVDALHAAAAADTLSENLRIADKMMKVEFSN